MDRGSILRVWLPLLGGLWGLKLALLAGPRAARLAATDRSGAGPYRLMRSDPGSLHPRPVVFHCAQSHCTRNAWDLFADSQPDLRLGSDIRNGRVPDVAATSSVAVVADHHPNADHPCPPGSPRARRNFRRCLSRIPPAHLVLGLRSSVPDSTGVSFAVHPSGTVRKHAKEFRHTLVVGNSSGWC